jgi:RNA polymerase sigma-70 factor, ECF subfamily
MSLERARTGDRAALDALLREHLPAIRRTVARCVGSGPEADDTVQQTLMAVVRGLPNFRGDAPVGAWIHRIAVRQAWASARSRANVIQFVECADPRPASGEVRAEAAHAVAHLNRLTPERRMAFVLHDVEGFSAREIAEMLDIPEGTVNSRIREARLSLRDALGATARKVS